MMMQRLKTFWLDAITLTRGNEDKRGFTTTDHLLNRRSH